MADLTSLTRGCPVPSTLHHTGTALAVTSLSAAGKTAAHPMGTVTCSSAPRAESEPILKRRALLQASTVAGTVLLTGLGGAGDANAMLGNRKAMREKQIPEEAYTQLPNGLKVYDVKVGGGKVAEKGDRVTIHYVVKWNGVTFMTSRQGMGVTGGTPYGFDLGASDRGYVLKGLDYAVEGMRVGGQRQVICPPELAYGDKGVQEIPAGATLEMDIELLAIKESPFGFQVKLVEG